MTKHTIDHWTARLKQEFEFISNDVADDVAQQIIDYFNSSAAAMCDPFVVERALDMKLLNAKKSPATIKNLTKAVTDARNVIVRED